MVCSINITEKPQLNDPVLIEGLPGIGFVANIAALHLIKELKATLFAQIFSSSFQDFAITTEDGGARSPINELYYAKHPEGGRDLIIWYGNTQALTTIGQYELVGKVLDICAGFRLQIRDIHRRLQKRRSTTHPSHLQHRHRPRNHAGSAGFRHQSHGWTRIWHRRFISWISQNTRLQRLLTSRRYT